MHDEVKAAAERLRRDKADGVVGNFRDRNTLADYALSLLDETPITEAALREMGFAMLVNLIPGKWSGSLGVVEVDSDGFLWIGHFTRTKIGPITTLGQLRLLLSALKGTP